MLRVEICDGKLDRPASAYQTTLKRWMWPGHVAFLESDPEHKWLTYEIIKPDVWITRPDIHAPPYRCIAEETDVVWSWQQDGRQVYQWVSSSSSSSSSSHDNRDSNVNPVLMIDRPSVHPLPSPLPYSQALLPTALMPSETPHPPVLQQVPPLQALPMLQQVPPPQALPMLQQVPPQQALPMLQQVPQLQQLPKQPVSQRQGQEQGQGQIQTHPCYNATKGTVSQTKIYSF